MMPPQSDRANWKTLLLAVVTGLLALAAPDRLQSRALALAPVPASEPNVAETLPLGGMNLESVAYYSRHWAFVDVFRSAGTWVTQNAGPTDSTLNPYDTGLLSDIPVDANGYPLSIPYSGPNVPVPQRVATLLCRSMNGRYPAGQYTLLYEGEGRIVIGLDGNMVSSQPGRILFNVTAPTSAGISLVIYSSTAGNHLRNIRVIMPGFESAYQTHPFHPLFLQRLAPFKVLRFMNWQLINNSTVTDWNQRSTPTWYSYADRGVALETMIDLCNTTGADPWFCIPHLASDDYVRQFATMVRDRLAPNRKIYIEYSNEVWNGMFAQSAYAMQMGQTLNLGSDQYTARNRYTAKRSVEIFRIFQSVMGGRSRLVRVLASQSVSTYVSETIMGYARSVYGPGSFDALAIAPYFGNDLGAPSTAAVVSQWSMDQLFAALSTRIDDSLAWVSAQKASADRYGVPLIAYEGGQHLVGYWGAENNDALAELFVTANRDARMYTALRRFHDGWWDRGGQTMCAFAFSSSYTKWGAWGYLEYQDQQPYFVPKWRALTDSLTLRQAIQKAGASGAITR